MIYIIVIMFLLIFVYYCRKNKIKINFKTFFKKGVYVSRGTWGVMVFSGRQGQGKTTAIVEYLKDHSKDIEIFCNIKDIRGLDYTYYEGFDNLLSIKKLLDIREKKKNQKQIVIVYDEIFTQLDKHSKLSREVIDFLCQMRKRKIIFLTSCQCWAELPLTFRRFCRYEIECSIISIFPISILKRVYHDAENMIWDSDLQDFVAPILNTTFSKYRKEIANSFDTYALIKNN